MFFEESKSIEKFGEKIGYIVAYFLFTTILFFILAVLNKIPPSWSYLHIMGITFLITLTGILIKRFFR